MEAQNKPVGEYRVEHLRPIPEHMSVFMPLWDRWQALLTEYAEIETRLERMMITLHVAPAPIELWASALWSLLQQVYPDGSHPIFSSHEYGIGLARLRELKKEESALLRAMRPLQGMVGPVDVIHNLVTNVGKNDLLDKYLKGSSYTQTIRMGLKGTGSAAAGDTQASHAGWLEQGLANAPTYTGNRKDVTMGSASSQVSTSPTQAFAITSSGTVYGCFINNGGSATKDDTTGILFSVGDFSGGSKAVANLDTLNVVYTLTAS